MTTYSVNLKLPLPVPFDPAVANIWGTIVDTTTQLLDTAIAGILSKSVAGNTNIALTNVNGAPDEARYASFIFTGVLTGNVVVLWPSAQNAIFTAENNTTGAFTLAFGANNGSLAPAGSTISIPQGAVGVFQSDGTNVTVRISPNGIGALDAANNLSDVDNAAAAYGNLGGGSMGTRALTIQNGGSPSGGVNGDVFFIY